MQLQQVPSLFLLSSFAAFFTGDKQAAVKQDKNNASFTQTYIVHMYTYTNVQLQQYTKYIRLNSP